MSDRFGAIVVTSACRLLTFKSFMRQRSGNAAKWIREKKISNTAIFITYLSVSSQQVYGGEHL